MLSIFLLLILRLIQRKMSLCPPSIPLVQPGVGKGLLIMTQITMHLPEILQTPQRLLAKGQKFLSKKMFSIPLLSRQGNKRQKMLPYHHCKSPWLQGKGWTNQPPSPLLHSPPCALLLNTRGHLPKSPPRWGQFSLMMCPKAPISLLLPQRRGATGLMSVLLLPQALPAFYLPFLRTLERFLMWIGTLGIENAQLGMRHGEKFKMTKRGLVVANSWTRNCTNPPNYAFLWP